jgi:glutaredoxin
LRDARDRAGQRARWLSVGFFGLVISLAGGLLAASSLRTSQAVEAERVAAPAAAPSAARPVEIEPANAPLPTTDFAENQPDPRADSAILAASTISSVVVPGPSAEPAPRARVPSSSELLAALHATPVSMFTTNWCPHCERARRFFQQNGVRVLEHDIDADARAAAELQRRTGSKAVPLIDVDGRELRGFDQRATIEALVASVERRLGAAGLKLSVASVPALRD